MHLSPLIREPLVHFFALGTLLFALFSWLNKDGMRAPDEITIDAARVAAIESQFERVWQRPPTPGEMAGLIDNWIREEVLYREGMALGLDRDDPVLRRRLAQKMEFITEDLVDSAPSESELRTFFEANAADYQLDARFSFEQLYFDPAARKESLDAAVANAVRALADGQIPDSDPTMLPATMSDASLGDVRRTFGDRFAEELTNRPVGDWTGPVGSAYGVHVVRIVRKLEPELPAFEEVRAAVDRDFRAEQTRQRKKAVYETMRKRYNVVFEEGITLAEERQGRQP